MLSKKSIIIAAGLFILLASLGGALVYKNYRDSLALTPAKLLASFEIKNQSLTPEVAQLFQQRFNETKEILQKEPDNFDKWLYLGVLKKGVGDYEGSRDVFIYAGQIRPGNSTSFGNLADLYTYFLNEPQKAESAIKQAIANDPNEYSFYLSLADIYRYKFPDGNALYEKTMLDALQKFPDTPNLIAPLAGFYRDTGQTAKAIEWYEKLLKLTPDNQAAKDDLAELRKKTQ